MSSTGASAICTRKMRSRGIERMALRSVLRASDMEAVEHQADGRMVGAAHRLPGVAVVVDVAAPGQRLEADAQAALGGPLAQLVAGRLRRDRCRRGTPARRCGTPAGDRSRAPASRRTCARRARSTRSRLSAGMPSKSRNGWKVTISRPRSRDQLAHVGGRAVEGEQVVLEDLDALEARRRRWLRASRRGRRSRTPWQSRSSWLASCNSLAPALRRPPPALPHRAQRAPPRTCDACARHPAAAP